MEALLVFCFFSWCELKSKYLSVFVGFLYTSMVILLLFLLTGVSRKAIWPLLSDGKGDLRVDGIQSVVEG